MEAYIIAGYRTAVGKAPRGVFRFTRADDLAAEVIRALVASVPNLDNEQIDDVIVGNATPEAEQGLNIARMISLMGLDTDKVPGVTVNRYCASGLDTIATAVAKIKAGMADCIIAGGVEVMSGMPFGGWKLVPNAEVAKNNPDWYWGMGLTAEAVAKEYNVNREDQDAFALKSHEKAIHAIKNGHLKDGVLPITVNENYLDANLKKKTRSYIVDTDEGPRADTTLEKLAKLKPVFDAVGSVTAGNSSQTSDGAAFVLVVSERKMKELNAEPIARLVSYGVAGVPPRIMGIGPIEAIPKALKQAGLKQSDMDLIELNEAFASQSLAIIRTLDLNPDIINVNGGAIALGHPLGCTGAKLTVQMMNELKRQDKKYGMVTMCVGTGQGAAGIFELL
ncbi:acetyl-CoA C-acyltransferase [Pedobacter jamesrossensis]|uniref:acetyl-CoA C-acyltransferase n=1 Tax=Pedobacter jamesrossensis TaxID=1908238 RepID=A0ABV8NG82_9SPHI